MDQLKSFALIVALPSSEELNLSALPEMLLNNDLKAQCFMTFLFGAWGSAHHSRREHPFDRRQDFLRSSQAAQGQIKVNPTSRTQSSAWKGEPHLQKQGLSHLERECWTLASGKGDGYLLQRIQSTSVSFPL